MTIQAPLVLLLVSILVAVASSSPNCDVPKAFSPSHEDQCSLYYDLLEEALVNDSDTLYQLKIRFFQMATDYDHYIYAALDDYGNKDLYIMPELVKFDVNITVDEIPLGRNCSLWYGDHPTFLNSSGKWTAQLSLQWSQLEPTSSIQKLKYTISSCFDVVYSFEGVVGLLMVPYIDDTPEMYCSVESEGNGGYFPDAVVSVPLHLGKLPCNPDSNVTKNVLTSLVSWAKAYARAQKIPDLWDENDRGTVNISLTVTRWSQYTIKMTLLILLVFLNILVMLLMVRFMPGYYRKLPFNDNSKEAYISIFWGLGTVSFLLAAIGTILDLFFFVRIFTALSNMGVSGFCSKHHHCCHNSIYPLITALRTRVVLTPLILLIELLVSILTVCKKTDLCVCFSRSNTTQQFCTCCSVNITCKFFHILALWGIMAFVQHITICVIIVSFFLISSTSIIPIVMFFASAIFCLIILTAHLFYICKVPRSLRTISAVCIQLMALMAFVGLIGALSFGLYYISFIINGLQFHGIGGFAVSLIPSIVLSAIGWYIKRKFLKNRENTNEEEELNGENPPQSVTGGQDLVEVVVEQSIDESEGEEEQTPLLHIN